MLRYLVWGVFIVLLSLRLIYTYSQQPAYTIGESITLTHTFLSDPKIYGRNQYFTVDGIKVFVPRFPEFSYGDTVRITGVVEKSISETDKRPVIQNPTIQKLQNNKTGFIFAITSFIRKRIEDSFFRFLPQQSAGLLLGIVLGVKEAIGKEFYDQLKQTGVLHVVAASGMNVTMLSGYLMALFLLFLRRQLAIVGMIICLFAYALISGFDPSIIRASIMASISFSAQALGRQNFSFYSLLITAWIMLFHNPKLVGDIGFQLSFASTAGILFLKPQFDSSKMMVHFKKLFIWDDLATTIAAQIATIPILLFHFNSYSLFSIGINALVLWTIPYLMLFGGSAAVLSLAAGFLAAPFLYLSYPLLLFFEAVIKIFSDKLPIVTFESMPPIIVASYYMLLIAFFILASKKKKYVK